MIKTYIGRNQGWSWRGFGLSVAGGAIRGILFAKNPAVAMRHGLGMPIGIIGSVGAGRFTRRIGW